MDSQTTHGAASGSLDRMVLRVGCVACGRIIAARRDGHPRHHKPKTVLTHGAKYNRGASGGPDCDGTNYPGEDLNAQNDAGELPREK